MFSLENILNSLFFTQEPTTFRVLQFFESKVSFHRAVNSDGIKDYILKIYQCIVANNTLLQIHFKCKEYLFYTEGLSSSL